LERVRHPVDVVESRYPQLGRWHDRVSHARKASDARTQGALALVARARQRTRQREVFAAVRGRFMPPVELLINDLEHDAAAVASSCGADDLAQRPRDPALTSDHLADVVLCDEQSQDDEV